MSQSIQLVCPACGALNRVQNQRLHQGPVCGRCRQPLLDGQPLHLNADRLLRLVEKDDLPLVVDFWAPWCGPCQSMAPAFAQAAALLAPQVRLAKLNTEENQELAARLGIRSIPTLVLFRHGREEARISGAMPAEAIVDWVRRHL